jgi:hypothetical protein
LGRKFDPTSIEILPLPASSSPAANSLFNEIDADSSGTITIEELIIALTGESCGRSFIQSKIQLKEAIIKYDTDGDGFLNRTEFAAALADLGGDAEWQPKSEPNTLDDGAPKKILRAASQPSSCSVIATHPFKPTTFRCRAHRKAELQGLIIDDHEAFMRNPQALVGDAHLYGGLGSHPAADVALWLSWGEKVSNPHVQRSEGWMRHQPPWCEKLQVTQDGATWYTGGHWECRPDFACSSVCSGFASMACELYSCPQIWKVYGGQCNCANIFGSCFATGGGNCGTKSSNEVLWDWRGILRRDGNIPLDDALRIAMAGTSAANALHLMAFKGTHPRCRAVAWEEVRGGDMFWWITENACHVGLVVSKVVVDGEERLRFWHSGGMTGNECARQYPDGRRPELRRPDGSAFTETAETGYRLSKDRLGFGGWNWGTVFWFLRKIPFDVGEHVGHSGCSCTTSAPCSTGARASSRRSGGEDPKRLRRSSTRVWRSPLRISGTACPLRRVPSWSS